MQVQCVECGKRREHAAFQLCFARYRAERRKQGKDKPTASAAEIRVANKQAKDYGKLIAVLKGIGTSRDDVQAVPAILEPYDGLPLNIK